MMLVEFLCEQMIFNKLLHHVHTLSTIKGIFDILQDDWRKRSQQKWVFLEFGINLGS